MAVRRHINRGGFSSLADGESASPVTNDYEATFQDTLRQNSLCKVVTEMFSEKKMKSSLITFQNVSISSNGRYEDVFSITNPSNEYIQNNGLLVTDIQDKLSFNPRMRVERPIAQKSLLLYVSTFDTRVTGRHLLHRLLLLLACFGILGALFFYLFQLNPNLYTFSYFY